MIEVPEIVRNKAVAVGAEAWLEALPDLVVGLQREWELTLGRTYTSGTEALVLDAMLGGGEPAVLKLLLPRDRDLARYEITALRLADGDGCARLLRDDVDRGALLLERLGPSLFDLRRPIDERLAVLADLAVRVWRPAPGSGLPTGAEKGRWLGEHIVRVWDELDHPCDERTIEHALACAERRVAAHDEERAVLVHGDIQQWNALQSDGGFKLVDPDGLLAEPEYDLGIIMREDPVELMEGDPRARARWLAERTGCDAEAIWEWGVVERVSTGLIGTQVGLQPVAGQMLAAADEIARRN